MNQAQKQFWQALTEPSPVIDADGTQRWYKNGKQHRDNDLPAIIYANGSQYWFKNGECHRDNDLPAIIYANGTQCWYKNGIKTRGVK